MNTDDEILAKSLLQMSQLTWSDGVRLVMELLERIHIMDGETKVERIGRLRHAIQLGAEQEEKERKTVFFEIAVRESVVSRLDRRPSTVADLQYLSRRLLRWNPELIERPLRFISTEECRQCLEKAFTTPSQFKKGRAFLHSVFAFGHRRGWCADNPVACVEVPMIHEREIEPLTLREVQRLTKATLKSEFKRCAPAVGIMLWAGVRPCEVSRLRWENIDWEENVIVLRPQHSKTGGARHVSIPPVLKRWLVDNRADGCLCPPNWKRQWSRLRNRACLGKWRQDTLRHTFASYHVKVYRNLSILSLEMGHVDLKLLHSRYVNLSRLTRADAKCFWKGDWLEDCRQKRLPTKQKKQVVESEEFLSVCSVFDESGYLP